MTEQYQFQKAEITWALGASMLLYFKGITSDFHDIDLMVANEDADKARTILMQMGTLEPQNPNPKYKTKLFMEFVVDYVDIDVMVGSAIVNGTETVDLWCEYYRLMGRTEKVHMIEKFVGKEKAGNSCCCNGR